MSQTVAFLTGWAADIRASSGTSVDADSLEEAATIITNQSDEITRLRTDLSAAEAALDQRKIASGLTSNGNLWRFWAEKAKDMAVKLSEAEQRVQEARRIAANAEHYGYVHGLEVAAQIGYVACAETRHVTLGDKVRSSIRSLIPFEPQPEKDKSQDDAEGRS